MKDFEMKKLPSETSNCYWISINTLDNRIPKEINLNGGKWLIFVSKDNVDKLWKKIRLGTILGFLGYKSKVSTAKPNPNATDKKSHVICVYTYDSNDKKDVMKVRKELKELGIKQEICFKTNRATLEGKYSKRGHKNICKYRK